MKNVIFLLVMLGPLLLLAEEVLEDVETPDVTAAEGLPSSLVNGTVCAISGQYIDSMVDVVIQGPEPLVISRTCGSLASPNLGCLWSFNHEGFMTGCKAYDREEGPIWLFRICQPSSSYLDYIASRGEEEDKKKHDLELKLREPKGLTNGATTLSGRTNLKNQKVHFYSQKEEIEVESPTGDKKIYFRTRHGKGWAIYAQKAEEKANRSLYTYEFDLHFMMPIQITCQNLRHRDRVYSQVNFSRIDEKEGEFHFDLNTSDGRKLSYYFRPHYYKKKIKAVRHDFTDSVNHYYLTRVEHPYAPSVKYDYEPRSGSDDWNLTSRERPENRFIKTSYYHKGKNHVGGQIGTVEIKDREDRCINRVKKQEAPVGSDATPIVTHRFKYHFKEHHSSDHHKSVEGSTDVYDAYDHLTRYHYDANQRLHSIIRYKGTSSHQPYVKEKFVWGSRREEKSFLRAKIFQDFNGRVHHARYFDYDERGNVLRSMLCGKLSPTLSNFI